MSRKVGISVSINTKKTLEVLSLLRPIVHDTSKTAQITWFILVLHWAVDVTEVLGLYYIHGPVEYHTVVQKNAPTSADYNYDPVQSILIILWGVV